MTLPRVSGWGNLAADPECRRYDEGGSWMATFAIYFNDRWVNRNTGRKQEQPCILRCVAFDRDNYPLAHQIAVARLQRGAYVFVRGRLKMEKWAGEKTTGTDDDHSDVRYSYELVLDEIGLPLPRLPGAGAGRAPGQGMAEEPPAG